MGSEFNTSILAMQLFVEASTDTEEAKDESDSDYEEDQVDEQTGLVGAHCPSVCQ